MAPSSPAWICRARRVSGHEVGRIIVYWPFVVFQRSRREWNVTHAPSGLLVFLTTTVRAAVRKIRALRRCPVDWEFQSMRGRKAKRAEAIARPHLMKLRAIG
jgi:hypothetical protein